jgi:LmbE family N-acetylglucosaminyl deacetylase
MNVIAIGAHPDDCEYYFGGTAAKLARAGHRVKFVSVTNGDAGHHRLSGEELIARRRTEAAEAARRLGIAATEVLSFHDGLLEPTLEARREIIRQIRAWRADLVFTHRPFDYHPDHRATSQIVQDSAFMVLVPNICPETSALRANPVYLYFEDDFRKPTPFAPDIAVAVDDAWNTKVAGLDAHDSQMYEWLPWVDWNEEPVPAERDARLEWLSGKMTRPISAAMRARLEGRYGFGASIQHAESFELCEYGRRPSPEELDQLLPR